MRSGRGKEMDEKGEGEKPHGGREGDIKDVEKGKEIEG